MESSASGEVRVNQEKPPANERDSKTAVQTKHTDFGAGLELFETTRLRSGKVVSTLKRYMRNGQMTMTEYSSPEVMEKAARAYYQNGKEIMAEQLDREGHVESMVFIGADGQPTEMFERKPDGTTRPVSTERLEKEKRGAKLFQKTFGPVAEAAKRGDEKQISQRVDEAIEKIKKTKAQGKNPPSGANDSAK
jgi:hypothetical protein